MKKFILIAGVLLSLVVVAVLCRIAYVDWRNNSDVFHSSPTAIILKNLDGETVGRFVVANNSLIYSGEEIEIDMEELEKNEHQYPTGGYTADFWGGYYWSGIQTTSIDRSDFLVGLFYTLEEMEDDLDNYTYEIEY
jgi:hypothetical protein